MNNNTFLNGARLVWKHQRIVWWIFAVSLVLGFFASMPARSMYGKMLNHSLASEKLVTQFDLGAMIELGVEPGITNSAAISATVGYLFVFFIFLLFIDGGVLTVYHEDRKLSKAEFFEMSGGYFWRMVRLMLLSLIPFAILGSIYKVVSGKSDKLTDDVANGRSGFFFLMAGCIVLWLLFEFVRAWFDLAQCRTVAQNERGMFRMTWRGLKSAATSSLTFVYASIHFIGMVVCALLLFLWSRIPHPAVGLSFITLELVMLVQIGTRLWQRASCMTWMDGHEVAVEAPTYNAPRPLLVQEPNMEFPPQP